MDRRLTFTIVGKSPLLTHNPASMQAPTSDLSKGGKRKAGAEIPTPAEEAERGLYLDEEGRFCGPGVGLRNALVKAAAAWRAPWQKKRENMRSLLAGCIVEPELVPVLDEKGKPAKTYAIDSRRALVQRNGIVRSRPKFPQGWRAAFTIVYDDAFIPGEEDQIRTLLQQIFDDAGNRIGWGDYRPEKTGWFGRFAVE